MTLFSHLLYSPGACGLPRLCQLPASQLLDLIQPLLSPGSHSPFPISFNGAIAPPIIQAESWDPSLFHSLLSISQQIDFFNSLLYFSSEMILSQAGTMSYACLYHLTPSALHNAHRKQLQVTMSRPEQNSMSASELNNFPKARTPWSPCHLTRIKHKC